MKSIGQLVMLSLSLVWSASALLIFHLDRVKSLDNNKSMGVWEASAGSAVGLSSVYDRLKLSKKKSWGRMCVSPPISELLILNTMVPLSCWSGHVWSLVMRFVQSAAGSHEGRGLMLQKWLALYIISRGFTWMGLGTELKWDVQFLRPE